MMFLHLERWRWVGLSVIASIQVAQGYEEPEPEAKPARSYAIEQHFHPPVRLEADGKVIDHGSAWGHCGPTMHDLDGDGKLDLVVGDFSGRFTKYQNIGTANEPKFGPGNVMTFANKPIKAPIY